MKIIGCSGGEIQRKVGNDESSDGGGPHIRLVHIPSTFNDTIINGKLAEQKQFVSVCMIGTKNVFTEGIFSRGDQTLTYETKMQM